MAGFGWCCWAVLAAGLAAGAEAPAPEAEAAPLNENDALALRARKMNESYRLERELRLAWTDPKYASEEIDALRKKRAELRSELEKTEWELRRKIEGLPPVMALRGRMEALRKEAAELERLAGRLAAGEERKAGARPGAARQARKGRKEKEE